MEEEGREFNEFAKEDEDGKEKIRDIAMYL